MGTLISRIEKEFVLGTVSDKGMEVRITGNKVEANCTITRIDDGFVYLELVDDMKPNDGAPGFTVGEKLGAYFSYFGHVMTFSATIRAAEKANIRIDFPDTLYKNLSRKYTRVPAPDRSTVSFSFQDTRVDLDFPKSEEYDPVEVPELAEEFDPQNLESLIDSFREKIHHKASSNGVVMFRDRSPRGFEETIISRTGKILYIPNTSGRFPENDYQIGGRIITRAMLLGGGTDDADDTQDRLPSLLEEKRKKGILAEIHCPILFREYTVGYLYLARMHESEGMFDHDLLEFAYQFSKVVAYSLKINGYFKDVLPDETNYDGQIVDISAAGLLFSNGSEQLRAKLALYTDLDLVLKFGDRTLRVVGRLMRKFQPNDMTFYGLQFMEMKPEDFRFLFEYVYGRAVRPEDEALWEGGSEPPELDL